MKIGIITYYNAVNEGAFLQAYCLKKFLEENFGYDAVFVPNANLDLFQHQKRQLFKTKNPRRLWININRLSALKRAKAEYLVEGETNAQYDAVIVGSDEMWNENNIVFSDYNTAAQILADKKISYAVSMGNSDRALSAEVINKLKDFTSYSVRDYNSQAVLEKSGIHKSQIHLDPVFLYSISAVVPKIDFDYIMIYGEITNKKIIIKIQEYAKRKGLKTVSVDIFNDWCDKKVFAKSPFEFVGFIDKASIVITNMFHGTMLSVIRNRSFISIQTKRRKKKIEYAARKLMFANRCVDELSEWEIDDILSHYLDYENINKTIGEERRKTKDYFRRAFM